MAKSAKSNSVFDVTGIIPEKRTKKENTQQNTQNIYTTLLNKQDTEKRNKRMQIVVKPSTFAYLEQLQKDGVIKSKNDLINNFLEDFIQQAEEHKE